MSSVTPLQHFLLHRRVEKGCPYTHTSLSRPAAAFYIGGDHEETFWQLYRQAVEDGETIHMTEKPRDIYPLIVDIDLRFQTNNENRQFTLVDVQKFLAIYMQKIRKYLVLQDAFVDIFVLVKPSPVVTDKCIKDGIHIVIPSIATTAAVQQLCREDCLKEVDEWAKALHTLNEAKDIYDESVLGRNNWMMFGSCKPGGERYQLHEVVRYDTVTCELDLIGNNGYTLAQLTEHLSVRNKYDACDIVTESQQRVEQRETRLTAKKPAFNHPAMVGNRTGIDRSNVCTNFEIVQSLVDILDVRRSDSYDSWMRLGWCLRNIDHRLKDKWIEFSRKSNKYVEGECEDKWDRMTLDGGIGMGTLCMWAREDDPDQYREIMRHDLRKLICASRTGTHCDVARVVHHMFGGRFVCASLRNKIWYEFRNHRWRLSDGACGLRRAISNDVWREFKNVASDYNRMSVTAEEEDDQLRYSEYEKKLLAVAEKLKVSNFKDNLMKECAEQFYCENFESKLDSKTHLIGFENGVYDVVADEFRCGRPDDYITFTTGNDYTPYDPNHPCVAEIKTFLSQVQPKQHIAKYCMTLLSSFLSGSILEERFHIWTGSGGNGKSRLVELVESCIGDYACKFPVTMLTQKRIACNAANAELARARGKRMAVMQEPSEDEKLNIGLMKELSGGDRIIARSLYSLPVEFKPQFHMLLMCNHLPHVDANDGGTWRRVRVVEFASRFVTHPNPEDPNEYPIDLELARKFEEWRPHFMGMLLDYYRLYQVEGLVEPEEVMSCTREYQRKNDFVADFIAEAVDVVPQDPSAYVRVDDLYEEFKEWARTENVAFKVPRRKDVQGHLERTFGKATKMAGNFVFRKMRLREGGNFTEDDD
jgi:P4 family phage/plasmid primase-like protien